MENNEDLTKDSILTLEEFASKARVHPSTIRRMIKAGKINAVPMGGGRGTFRIRASELPRIFDKAMSDLIKSLVDERVDEIIDEKMGKQNGY